MKRKLRWTVQGGDCIAEDAGEIVYGLVGGIDQVGDSRAVGSSGGGE
jgi:hypothetical protein